jgi:SpoVK/Ycf46/Vps4 family AAA+-type ATPase
VADSTADRSHLRAQIIALRTALSIDQSDDERRLRLAEALIEDQQVEEAMRYLGEVLAHDPALPLAASLMRRALNAPQVPGPAAMDQDALPDVSVAGKRDSELGTDPLPVWMGNAPEADASIAVDVRSETVRLVDVAGMEQVKERLDAAFLAPMGNLEIARAYGHSMSGGLLLYGPPGCGKTFIARAVAGELGAKFVAVSLADALDMWMGSSEKNIHKIFETARANSPCVLFIDEVDALGGKRSNMHHSGMRNVVSQLLTEMDSAGSNNAGVFILGATNHPWDIDTALRRPGRFDRMLFVPPPDDQARLSIIHLNLRDRPVGQVAYADLVRRTDSFSGADVAHLCHSAAERAMLDSIRTKRLRDIEDLDFDVALKEVKPSTRTWFESARQIAQFANHDNAYDELVSYLRTRKQA